jgi:hypothetical protein
MTLLRLPIVLRTPLWGDDRVWCKFARRNDIHGAINCPNLQDGICSLNGSEAPTPRAFDEPPDAPIWGEIRDSVAEYRRKGWTQ